MNNKDLVFLAGLQESMREFVALDKGKVVKEMRAESKALEKAAGGAKKLAEAGKVLADAEGRAEQIVAAAKDAAEPILRAAEKVRVEVLAERDKMKTEILDKQHDLGVAQSALVSRSQRVDTDIATLSKRETAVSNAESENKVMAQTLENERNRLSEREKELDARSQRFKDAAA